MEETFSNLETYGYIGLFLYSLGGGFLALLGAGVLSYLGKMDLTTSIAIAFTANALGDVALRYKLYIILHSAGRFIFLMSVCVGTFLVKLVDGKNKEDIFPLPKFSNCNSFCFKTIASCTVFCKLFYKLRSIYTYIAYKTNLCFY